MENDDRGRDWVCTLHNLEDYCEYRIPDENIDELERYAYQHEIGEDGRDHIQIFVRLKTRQRPSRLLTILGVRGNQIHWERCRYTKDNDGNTHAHNSWFYCQKEETRHCGPHTQGNEEGLNSGHGGGGGGGKRSGPDVGPLITGLRGGRSLFEMAHDDETAEAMLKYSAGAKFLRAVLDQPDYRRFEPKRVFIFWGGTGIGKTRTVYEEVNRANLRLWCTPVGAKGIQSMSMRTINHRHGPRRMDIQIPLYVLLLTE